MDMNINPPNQSQQNDKVDNSASHQKETEAAQQT